MTQVRLCVYSPDPNWQNAQDSDNNTILILLAEARPPASNCGPDNHEFYNATLRMARLYYDRYPDTLDWANCEGKTAVHFAAMRGNEELLRVRTRLYHSHAYVYSVPAQMLCDLDADIDLPDNEGNAPLH